MENKKEPLRILLADDHRVLRKGLSLLLSSEEDFSVVAEASDGEEALEKAAKTPVDIALLDLSMPRMGGLECLRCLKAMQPAVRVLILTMHSERQYVCECLRAGANGYLCKDTLDAELFRALRTVAAGGRYLGEREAELLIDGALEEPAAPAALSAREREVLELIVHGTRSRPLPTSSTSRSRPYPPTRRASCRNSTARRTRNSSTTRSGTIYWGRNEKGCAYVGFDDAQPFYIS